MRRTFLILVAGALAALPGTALAQEKADKASRDGTFSPEASDCLTKFVHPLNQIGRHSSCGARWSWSQRRLVGPGRTESDVVWR